LEDKINQFKEEADWCAAQRIEQVDLTTRKTKDDVEKIQVKVEEVKIGTCAHPKDSSFPCD